MKKFEYYLFEHSNDSKVGHVENLEGIQKAYNLKKGIPCGEYMPDNCELTLHDSGGDLATDLLDNINKLVLISSAAKDIFEKCGAINEHVEYLSFTLKNKKGKVAADKPYYIANCLRKIECLDLDAIKLAAEEDCDEDDPELRYYSGVYYYNYEQGLINEPGYFCLKEDKLPEDAAFFRIGECPEYMIIRSDLVEVLQKSGMTGLCLKEMDKPEL